MKQLISIAAICCIAAQMYGQVTVGLRIATSPNVSPGTNYLIVNRQDPVNESLFNIEQVNYSEQLGLMARLDRGQFWFMSELMYGQRNAQYSMIHTHDVVAGQAPEKMSEKHSFLEMPVSAGISLGFLEIFSGFSIAHDFGFKNDLESLEGYNASIPALRYGWHGGIGVNVGHMLFDIRYQQEFGNYGQNRILNGQELLLKNAPGRIVMTTGFRI